jgi:hypothetical protein
MGIITTAGPVVSRWQHCQILYTYQLAVVLDKLADQSLLVRGFLAAVEVEQVVPARVAVAVEQVDILLLVALEVAEQVMTELLPLAVVAVVDADRLA